MGFSGCDVEVVGRLVERKTAGTMRLSCGIQWLDLNQPA
jgi:hypothetical protein